MNNLKNNTTLAICSLVIIIVMNACSSKYIKLVSPDTKTEFGITLTSPSRGVFFVENQKIPASKNKIEIHTKVANSLYNNYGPATDNRFIGRTNARQLKFVTNNKTYLIDITKLQKRTAMVIFDGKNKPIIKYNSKRYNASIEKYFIGKSK
ncbi:hypothetical protein ACQKCJ_09085 [Flavobacterium sp. NPDC079362]|uniref:hypothetical protein n=1 Tax=Flavobacterium sp. NPDC079362 TaxID=3390566 RepID=UPI003D0121A5